MGSHDTTAHDGEDSKVPSHDGIDRRDFLSCMAWGGTGLLWTVAGGVPTSRLFAQTPAPATEGSSFSFVQISDSHIGFSKPANMDVTATLKAAIDKIATDAPSTLLLSHALIPVEVKSVLRQKCADCHSTQTRWPSYSRFAPASWLMEHDITEAREQMDLSKWESLPDADILTLRAEIAGVARAHTMPPLQYRLADSDVTITDDDIKLLRDWARGDVMSKLDPLEKSSPDAGPGDADRGKQVFASRCAGCHTLEQNREGPKLAGIFGRASGTAPGFISSFAS